jgi:hypothetical protein|tara:strand:+ start:6710 stop:7003 length:294 start_codon:yes stop_codon:yes gene_type:complete
MTTTRNITITKLAASGTENAWTNGCDRRTAALYAVVLNGFEVATVMKGSGNFRTPGGDWDVFDNGLGLISPRAFTFADAKKFAITHYSENTAQMARR